MHKYLESLPQKATAAFSNLTEVSVEPPKAPKWSYSNPVISNQLQNLEKLTCIFFYGPGSLTNFHDQFILLGAKPIIRISTLISPKTLWLVRTLTLLWCAEGGAQTFPHQAQRSVCGEERKEGSDDSFVSCSDTPWMTWVPLPGIPTRQGAGDQREPAGFGEEDPNIEGNGDVLSCSKCKHFTA